MSASKTERLVGLIGLGNMGMAVGKTLLRAGEPLLAHDLRAQALDEIERSGARRARSLADMADCGIVRLLVRDDAEVLDVAGGLIGQLASGSTIIVHATVRPTTVLEVAERARGRAIDVVDAPVSGGNFDAERAELTLMVGGPTDVVERCRAHLELLGTVHHVGALGTGAAMKLVNNLMLNGHYALVCEALELAAAFGIAEPRVREIVLESSGACWSIEHLDHLDDLIVNHTSARDPRFGQIFSKDARAAVATAREARVPVPLGEALQELLPEIVARRRRAVSETRAKRRSVVYPPAKWQDHA